MLRRESGTDREPNGSEVGRGPDADGRIVQLNGLRLRSSDIRDTDDDGAERQRHEGLACRGWVHERERHVPGLELDPGVRRVWVPVKSEGVFVEPRGALAVLDGHGDEVDALGLDQGVVPSACA